VRSAVIRLTRNDTHSLGCDEALFKKVVKTTFNQRRKTLRNNLRPLLQEMAPTADYTKFLSSALFDLRPEQLSVEQFVSLTNEVRRWSNSSE